MRHRRQCPPEATAHWLAACSAELRGKLATLGLAPDVVTVGGLVERYRARAAWRSLKLGTQESHARCFRFLCQHFDPTTPIGEITHADAREFYAALRLERKEGGMGQAISTANVVASSVATLFNFAIDAELVVRNPFKKLPHGTRRGNNAMVSLAESLAVLDAIRGTERKLLFGLSRWGGLRTMSEQRALRWGDVDWERKRFLVHSPKTERHEGRSCRWVPMFPELAPLFEARFDEADEGDEAVLPNFYLAHKGRAANMLETAIKRAGVNQWPRLWHSLRATRRSELTEIYPAHVVSAWIGNTVEVAAKHYLMVTDEHFTRATQNATQHSPANVDNRQQTTGQGDG